MCRLHLTLKLCVLGFIVMGANAACAQTYPARPIRIVTSEAGGGNDFAARLMVPGLSEALGQQVLVDNRGAAIAGELVAKAAPDGYTMILGGTTLWLSQFLRKNVPYDLVADFSPVTLAIRQPNLLVVHPSLPVKSTRELVALAKARPGELNYSSGPIGTPQHLTGELFNAVARVNIVVIPYRGSGPAVTALLGGQVQLMFPTAGAVNEHVKAGRLRALAVTSAQPSPLLPGLPAVAEAVPGYESISIQAVYVPAKTPEAIVRRLNQEFVRVLNLPDVRERLMKAGVEPVGSSSEQLAAAIKTEMSKWGALIKSNGIHE